MSAQGKKVFSLLQVCKSVEKTLSSRYASSFWVTAEMIKLNHYKHSGHCYPELVEKQDGKVVAQLKATLWRADYQRIDQRFNAVLKQPLTDGTKILFEASIQYDAVHGLSLHIHDIDPVFTLGDLERERQDTIDKLKLEGVFGLNKSRSLPALPKRIAVISVETSKGFQDFQKVLNENPFGYGFLVSLFPALLQGEKAVTSIKQQLARIEDLKTDYDAIAILRGGGGDVGLSSFNSYVLCSAIARCSLPVLTGIGHAANETVAEMVSFQNAITPTAMADFLIQRFHNFAVPLQDQSQRLSTVVYRRLGVEKMQINHQLKLLQSHHKTQLILNANLLATLEENLIRSAGRYLQIQKEKIDAAVSTVENFLPERLLKQGYSIARINGKVVVDARDANKDDEIRIELWKGELKGKVLDRQITE